jgi:site-specific recombinase XerD
MNIPTPHFLLREPNSKKPTLISCHIRFKNDRIIFSVGERILPVEWDSSKQRAINSKKYPHNSELNIWLDKVDSEIKSVFRSFNLDNVSPTPEVIKERINDKLFNKVNSKIPSLLTFIESYIQECAKIKNPNAVRTYVTTFKHLQSYAHNNKINLDYTSITLNFYNSFVDYLMNDLQLSQNTIGKHIQVFKTFMNEATDRGYNKKLEFRGRKFKRLTEPVESIYLNKEELEQIRILDLTEKPTLERVRDLFIIGCYTGLRYSDFTKIRPENVKLEEVGTYFNILTQKTSTKVVIPLNPIVINILKKYNGFIPAPLSNQKMNQYLKVIGELAGITNKISITRTKAGKKTKTVIPKYMLIHTHSCRKSFATNAFLAGVPTLAIMKITGHTTENQFLKYVKISEEENANNLINHKFFTT